MGLFSRAFGLDNPVVQAALDAAPAAKTFDVSTSTVDPAVFGLAAYEGDASGPVPRINRESAIQVPAVKRVRDIVANGIGSIPFEMLDTENVVAISNLLVQPEKNRGRSVSFALLAEDLLLEGVGWWRIVGVDYRGYPTKVVRLLPRTVQQRQDGRTYYKANTPQGTAWIWDEDESLIRFESPTDPLLAAGARAIRTYLRLASAADRYAKTPRPSVVLTPTDDADPADDDDISEMLDDYEASVNRRGVIYLPAALNMNANGYSPVDLQLNEQMTTAVLEIARTVGIDPEDLGVSTTSRTYQNSQDRRIARLNEVLGPYIAAIEDRLSMGDITPRGYRVKADFNGFLRADDSTRLANYQTGIAMGLYTLEQVAERENLPTPIAKPTPAPAEEVVEGEVVQSAIEPGKTFDSNPAVVGFDTEETRQRFEVDVESRTITGLAVPYGVPSSPKGGQRFSFSKGSLVIPADPKRVKMLISHDRSTATGYLKEYEDTDEGLLVKFSVARGESGDRALQMAEDGVYDGLSIGLRDGGQFSKRGGIHHSVSNEIAEISLTPDPAFSDARVSAVAAEADSNTDRKDAEMGDQDTPSTAPAFDMDAMVAAMGEKFSITPKTDGPEKVGHAAPVFVTEESPYRFDRGGRLQAGAYDFSTDLIAGSKGDKEAADRALAFTRENLTFDVDTADATSLNPNGQKPELYVDRRSYRYRLLEATRAGTLTDKTPFVIPKFNSATGLVAAHTEGVEPTPGTFTAQSQTVTPGALSGKVEITRELWDQGGNPNISSLIWAKMEEGYYEAAEARITAALVAEAANITDIALTTGGGTTGQTLNVELGQAIAALQYVRGGFRFNTLATQIDLFQAIIGARDTTGRPLFPILGAQNANGTAEPRLTAVNVYGVDAFPEYSLAATGSVVANSWLFDSNSVRTWLSAPERLEFQYRVAYVDLAIWGYQVAAVIDTAGVRQITYDPVV